MLAGYKYKAAFQASECQTYGPNGLLLFALSIRYNIDDIHSLAANCLTDKSDDKKIDAIYIDVDELQTAIIIQSYVSEDETKPEAPANKAADLNTAVTWAFNMSLDKVPERIRANIIALRDGIQKGTINTLEFWYVHNLNKSVNVSKELEAVTATANAAIKTNYSDADIVAHALEVGNEQLEDWFLSRTNSIIVTDEFNLGKVHGFEIREANWNAYSCFIKARWLYEIYRKYGEQIFSANIRGYLGSRKSDKNINSKIKETCQSEPSNFWVYNNGITCLVNKYKVDDHGELIIDGFSIVNGAQTTGAIGSVDATPTEEAKIPTRFIVCQKADLIENIIRYNNSQNKISAADFRSNDSIQRRLREEFQRIPDATYKGRRGGAEDVIRRTANLISSDTVAQSLAAFHGDPNLAYNERSEIWQNDRHYSQYFNSETTAKHIVFTYSLLKALQEKKESLRANVEKLTGGENEQLEILRYRGSILLLVNAVSECCEVFMGRRMDNKFKISFGEISPEAGIGIWKPIIEATLPFCLNLKPALELSLGNSEKNKETIQTFRTLVEATQQANREIFGTFQGKVIVD
jgi:archaellum component FlaF (FlaF/FlaG flagellin family)